MLCVSRQFSLKRAFKKPTVTNAVTPWAVICLNDSKTARNNGYNGGWPSARLFCWSAADWSRPATNKSISSERESLLFYWERKSWTSWLLTCCSKKGWAAEKSSKKGVNRKEKSLSRGGGSITGGLTVWIIDIKRRWPLFKASFNRNQVWIAGP